MSKVKVIKGLPSTNKKLSSLKEALSYKNEMIIYKFLESYKLSFKEANALFTETKRWLWFCAHTTELTRKGEKVPAPSIGYSLVLMDEMWHTFILFTKEYSEYCHSNFGFYIHHSPTTKKEKDFTVAELNKNPKKFEKEYIERIEKFYGYVYDVLGSHIVIRWFQEYPKKYSMEKIKTLYIGL